ncbi:hypothetical protein BC827DRAFT_91751 [Russula dissimulans]|nr:hypothetical protein BC827DRAFT_91751 [Russula dissimulans]
MPPPKVDIVDDNSRERLCTRAAALPGHFGRRGLLLRWSTQQRRRREFEFCLETLLVLYFFLTRLCQVKRIDREHIDHSRRSWLQRPPVGSFVACSRTAVIPVLALLIRANTWSAPRIQISGFLCARVARACSSAFNEIRHGPFAISAIIPFCEVITVINVPLPSIVHGRHFNNKSSPFTGAISAPSGSRSSSYLVFGARAPSALHNAIFFCHGFMSCNCPISDLSQRPLLSGGKRPKTHDIPSTLYANAIFF